MVHEHGATPHGHEVHDGGAHASGGPTTTPVSAADTATGLAPDVFVQLLDPGISAKNVAKLLRDHPGQARAALTWLHTNRGNAFVLDVQRRLRRRMDRVADRDGAMTDDQRFAAWTSLVQVEGTATDADRDLVLAELMRLPEWVASIAVRKNVRIRLCRGSVVEAEPRLAGRQPRGWPPGATFEQVPGVYDPASKSVIIAIDATNHGSINLLFHELGHGLDAVLDGSQSNAFRTAYNADKAATTSYEQQADGAGLSESFGESFARFHEGGGAGGHSNGAHGAAGHAGGTGGHLHNGPTANTPNLDAFWANGPYDGDRD